MLCTSSCGKVINGMAKRSAVRGVRAHNRQNDNEEQKNQKQIVEEQSTEDDFDFDESNGGSSSSGEVYSNGQDFSRQDRLSKISSKYAVKSDTNGLYAFETKHLGISKERVTLHYSYAGQDYTVHWLHDYLVKNGKYCFAVSNDSGDLQGLLPVSRINKLKSGENFSKAGQFARKVKETLKKQKSESDTPF